MKYIDAFPNKQCYQTMLFVDQEGKKFAEIAKESHISIDAVRLRYRTAKKQQFTAYINCIKNSTEDDDEIIIEMLNKALEFYVDKKYVVAFLEKKYGDLLNTYREGEPGLPNSFLDSLPPIRECIDDHELINRIIYSKEEKKKSFVLIGKEEGLTREKVRDLYERYYHNKKYAAIKLIKHRTGHNIYKEVVKTTDSTSEYKLWKYIVDNYGEHIKDLIKDEEN